MKAMHLTASHVGKILVTGNGGKRKRGTILDLDLTKTSFVEAVVDYPRKGPYTIALPLDDDIEIEN